MGIVGGGILTVIYGAVSDATDRQIAYWVMIPCYIYILFFAAKGYKIGNAKAA